MVEAAFSGRIRIEMRDVRDNSVVYSYEGDNKIVGVNAYGTVRDMLALATFGLGYVEYKHVPKKPNGDLEDGWYSADGLFYFKKENPGEGYGRTSQDRGVPASATLVREQPTRLWDITTAPYIFGIGAFEGKRLDCAFIWEPNGRDWSVIAIPSMTPTRYNQIYVWYTLSFQPNIGSGVFSIDLAGTVHTVTYKPARWNDLPVNVSAPISLGIEAPRVWHYTNVTSLGDNSGILNGDNFNCSGIYRDYELEPYMDGSMRRLSKKFFDVSDLNCAPNGISGLLIRSGKPYQYTQMMIDPPIMKNTDMKLTLMWQYVWGVINERVR